MATSGSQWNKQYNSDVLGSLRESLGQDFNADWVNGYEGRKLSVTANYERAPKDNRLLLDVNIHHNVSDLGSVWEVGGIQGKVPDARTNGIIFRHGVFASHIPERDAGYDAQRNFQKAQREKFIVAGLSSTQRLGEGLRSSADIAASENKEWASTFRTLASDISQAHVASGVRPTKNSPLAFRESLIRTVDVVTKADKFSQEKTFDAIRRTILGELPVQSETQQKFFGTLLTGLYFPTKDRSLAPVAGHLGINKKGQFTTGYDVSLIEGMKGAIYKPSLVRGASPLAQPLRRVQNENGIRYEKWKPEFVTEDNPFPQYGIPNVVGYGGQTQPMEMETVLFGDAPGIPGASYRFYNPSRSRVDARGETDKFLKTKLSNRITPEALLGDSLRFNRTKQTEFEFGAGEVSLGTMQFGEEAIDLRAQKGQNPLFTAGNKLRMTIPEAWNPNTKQWAQPGDEGAESTAALAQQLRNTNRDMLYSIGSVEMPMVSLEATSIASDRGRGHGWKGLEAPTGMINRARLGGQDVNIDLYTSEAKAPRLNLSLLEAKTNQQQRYLLEAWTASRQDPKEAQMAAASLAEFDRQMSSGANRKAVQVDFDKLASAGAYNLDASGFATKLVDEQILANKDEEIVNQANLDLGGMGYLGPRDLDVTPMHPGEFKLLKDDWKRAGLEDGMSEEQIEEVFNKRYTYGKKKAGLTPILTEHFPGGLLSRAAIPHIMSNITAKHTASLIFQQGLTALDPALAKRVGLDPSEKGKVTRGQASAIGLLSYVAYQKDIRDDKETVQHPSALDVTQDQAAALFALKGQEIPPEEFPGKMRSILGLGPEDVNTMPRFGKDYVPNPNAVENEQYLDIEGNPVGGIGGRYSNAVMELATSMLQPGTNTQNTRRMSGSQNALWQHIRGLDQGLIKKSQEREDPLSIRGGDYPAPFLAPGTSYATQKLLQPMTRRAAGTLEVQQREVSRFLREKRIVTASQRDPAAPGESPMPGINIPFREMRTLLGKEVWNRIRPEMEAQYGIYGSSAIGRGQLGDKDYDTEYQKFFFDTFGPEILKTFGDNILPKDQVAFIRGKEAAKFPSLNTANRFNSYVQSARDAIRNVDPTAKNIAKRATLPYNEVWKQAVGKSMPVEHIGKEYSVGLTLATANKFLGRKGNVSDEASYMTGVDYAELGDSNLSQALSSIRFGENQKGEQFFGYSRPKPQGWDKEWSPVNRVFSGGGKEEQNIDTGGLQNFMQQAAVDATAPYSDGSYTRSAASIANKFGTSEEDEAALRSELEAISDKGQWGMRLVRRISATYRSLGTQKGNELMTKMPILAGFFGRAVGSKEGNKEKELAKTIALKITGGDQAKADALYSQWEAIGTEDVYSARKNKYVTSEDTAGAGRLARTSAQMPGTTSIQMQQILGYDPKSSENQMLDRLSSAVRSANEGKETLVEKSHRLEAKLNDPNLTQKEKDVLIPELQRLGTAINPNLAANFDFESAREIPFGKEQSVLTSKKTKEQQTILAGGEKPHDIPLKDKEGNTTGWIGYDRTVDAIAEGTFGGRSGGKDATGGGKYPSFVSSPSKARKALAAFSNMYQDSIEQIRGTFSTLDKSLTDLGFPELNAGESALEARNISARINQLRLTNPAEANRLLRIHGPTLRQAGLLRDAQQLAYSGVKEHKETSFPDMGDAIANLNTSYADNKGKRAITELGDAGRGRTASGMAQNAFIAEMSEALVTSNTFQELFTGMSKAGIVGPERTGTIDERLERMKPFIAAAQNKAILRENLGITAKIKKERPDLIGQQQTELADLTDAYKLKTGDMLKEGSGGGLVTGTSSQRAEYNRLIKEEADLLGKLSDKHGNRIKGLVDEEKALSGVQEQKRRLGQEMAYENLKKQVSEGETKLASGQLTQEDVTKLGTLQGRLQKIDNARMTQKLEQEAMAEENTMGGAARRMLSGFGLMYFRSIGNIITGGMGQGQEQAMGLNQAISAQAAQTFGIRQPVYSPQMALLNKQALMGANANPLITAQTMAADYPVLGDVFGTAMAGVGAWGATQWIADSFRKGSTASKFFGKAALPVGIATAVVSGGSQIYQKTEDQESLAYRLSKFDEAKQYFLAPYDVLAQTFSGGYKYKPFARERTFEDGSRGALNQERETWYEQARKQIEGGTTFEQLRQLRGSGGLAGTISGGTRLLMEQPGMSIYSQQAVANVQAMYARNPNWTINNSLTQKLASGMDLGIRDQDLAQSILSGAGRGATFAWQRDSKGSLRTDALTRYLSDKEIPEEQRIAITTGAEFATSLPGVKYMQGHPMGPTMAGGARQRTETEINDLLIKFEDTLSKFVGTPAENVIRAQQEAYMANAAIGRSTTAVDPTKLSPLMSPREAANLTASATASTFAAEQVRGMAQSQYDKSTFYGNASTGNKIYAQMTGMTGGQAEFYNRALGGDPMAMATLALGGMDLGQLPGVRTMQGNTINANYLAMTDTNNGRLTGLPYGTTGLEMGSLSSQQMGQNIFGTTQNRSVNAAVNGVQLAQPITLGSINPATGQPNQITSIGGIQGEQYSWMQQSYGYQQQGFALQQQGLQSGWAHTQTMWGIQDKQIALSNWYQQQQFGLQQEQINQSAANINIGNTIQQTQMNLTRTWAKEDWGYQDQLRNMQWGWKQEDFAEESRFMTGRQRKLAERKMGRETTMHNMEGDQIEKQRARQEELWKLEDERFNLQKKQQLESLAMQQKQLDLQKKYYEEQKKLQAEQVAEERRYAKEQYALQQKQLALAEEQARAAHEHEEAVFQMQLAIMSMGGELNTLSGEGMEKLRIGLAGVLDQINLIYEAGTNPPPVQPAPQDPRQPKDTLPVNYPYLSNQTEDTMYNDTTYLLNNAVKQDKKQTINIYLGNEHLSRFVIDAVAQELRS